MSRRPPTGRGSGAINRRQLLPNGDLRVLDASGVVSAGCQRAPSRDEGTPGAAVSLIDGVAFEKCPERCSAYIFPGVKNVPVDVSAHARYM